MQVALQRPGVGWGSAHPLKWQGTAGLSPPCVIRGPLSLPDAGPGAPVTKATTDGIAG